MGAGGRDRRSGRTGSFSLSRVMHKHEWHEPAGEGDTRYVRAMFHAGRWTFEDTLKSEEAWHSRERLPLRDLETLRDLLWKKYQRGRVPHGHVSHIDKLIAEARSEDQSPASPAV